MMMSPRPSHSTVRGPGQSDPDAEAPAADGVAKLRVRLDELVSQLTTETGLTRRKRSALELCINDCRHEIDLLE